MLVLGMHQNQTFWFWWFWFWDGFGFEVLVLTLVLVLSFGFDIGFGFEGFGFDIGFGFEVLVLIQFWFWLKTKTISKLKPSKLLTASVLVFLSHERMRIYNENCSSVCHALNGRKLNARISRVKRIFMVFLKTNIGFRDRATRIWPTFSSKLYWSARNQ